jgi:hypothetical protein
MGIPYPLCGSNDPAKPPEIHLLNPSRNLKDQRV